MSGDVSSFSSGWNQSARRPNRRDCRCVVIIQATFGERPRACRPQLCQANSSSTTRRTSGIILSTTTPCSVGSAARPLYETSDWAMTDGLCAGPAFCCQSVTDSAVTQ